MLTWLMGAEPNGPTNLIRLPSVEQWGPAMRALKTDGQRRFVMALLEIGSNNHTRAALIAGYEGNTDTLKVTAYRLFHDPGVQQAMHEVAHSRLNAGKIMAVSTLLNIAENAKEDKDKLKAIGMVLNRTGLHEKTEHHVTTQDVSKTDAALVQRAKDLAKGLGLDDATLQKMLGGAGVPKDAIDGEFTEVVLPEKILDEVFPKDFTGLEDL